MLERGVDRNFDVGKDSVFICRRAGDLENVVESRQRGYRNIVNDAVFVRHRAHRVDIAGRERFVQLDLDSRVVIVGHGNIHIYLTAADALADILFQFIFQEAVTPAGTAGELVVAMVDALDLYDDITVADRKLRSAETGHRHYHHHSPFLF